MGQKRVLVVLFASVGVTLVAIAVAQLRQTRVSSASDIPTPKLQPRNPQPIRFPNLTDLFPPSRVEDLPSLEEPIEDIPLPEANWRLKAPSQADTAENHHRLMQGTIPPDSRRSRPSIPEQFSPPPLPPVFPSSQLKQKAPSEFPGIAEQSGPTGGIRSSTTPISAEPTPTQTDTHSEANFTIDPAGSKPRLDIQPTQPQQETFRPNLSPLTKPPQDQSFIPPSIAIATPTAYGRSWGEVGIGVGLQARTRFTEQPDGAIGVSFGIGNEQTAVALDTSISILDVVGNPGRDGSVSFKVHRRLPRNFAVALGFKNAITWGDTDGGSSVYGVVSRQFDLRSNRDAPMSRLYLSAGVGGGQYRSESSIVRQSSSTGVFGSVAVQALPFMNAIAEWTGQDLNVGLSIIPFAGVPLVITPAVADLTGQAGDGRRFILGVGYAFSF